MARFKTTEWSLATVAAAHELKRAGFRQLSAHMEDMGTWMLLHLYELEHIGERKFCICSRCNAVFLAKKKRCPACKWQGSNTILDDR